MTWLLRGVGFVLMLIGFALVFSPAKAVADVVPFLGGLVGMGTMLFATLLSLMLSLITIAAGWIFYRPLYAIALLVGAGLIGFAAVRLGGRFGAGKKAL